MSEPFWQEGLRFECQPNCGACCNQKGEVHVSGEEIHRLATFLRLPQPQFRKRYLRRTFGKYVLQDGEGDACIFLDEKMQCSVYEARPGQCRAYPFWPQVLQDRLAWDWESLKCPGIGKGQIIPVAEIKRRVATMSGGEGEKPLK